MLTGFLFYLFSFFIIWWGAGLILNSVEKLSHKLNISSFASSFFILGLLTSLPEISVGVNSIIENDPEIFIGNLIGASLVMFLLVIPILAILGNGIKLTHQLGKNTLLLSLVVTASPVFLIVDGNVNFYEGLLLIMFYLVLFYFIQKKKGLLEVIKDKLFVKKTHFASDIIKIIFSSVLIFIASRFIVDMTIYYSKVFHISPFLISLLFLSVGTNLPELSLAVKSTILGKKEVALGDYIGSAAANTVIFGSLVLVNRSDIIVANHFIVILIFTILGFGMFYFFSRSKNDISRMEGIFLLSIYVVFIILESFL
jgi:cation:H+ antiporter